MEIIKINFHAFDTIINLILNLSLKIKFDINLKLF